jgi:glyoxylase-like metal-dependent hydrolase (beta-lactamase superfamily II)
MLTQLHLPIVNVTVIRQRHTILVDTGAPGDAQRILGGLQRLGISAGEVSLIVLTHGHSDHAGSAAELRRALGAPVAMHTGDLDLVRRGTNGDFVNMGLEAAASRRFVDRPFPAFEPDILLEEGSDLTAFGLEATLLHTPGHSQGSLSLLLDGGTAIAGDILRGGLLGGKVFAGRPSYPYFMPSLDALASDACWIQARKGCLSGMVDRLRAARPRRGWRGSRRRQRGPAAETGDRSRYEAGL